mgnify:CR=1 FL=1
MIISKIEILNCRRLMNLVGEYLILCFWFYYSKLSLFIILNITNFYSVLQEVITQVKQPTTHNIPITMSPHTLLSKRYITLIEWLFDDTPDMMTSEFIPIECSYFDSVQSDLSV